MNDNYISMILNMSIEELENKLGLISFTNNEREFFNKGKDLIDQGFKMKPYDSKEKLLNSLVIYYVLKSKEQNKQ